MNELELRIMEKILAAPGPIPAELILNAFGDGKETTDALAKLTKQGLILRTRKEGRVSFSPAVNATEFGLGLMGEHIKNFYDSDVVSFIKAQPEPIDPVELEAIKKLLANDG